MLVCPLCRIALGPKDAVCPRDGYKGRAATPCAVPATLKKRFHVLELFGHGAGGSSYLADETETGRRGLLKILTSAPESQTAERQRLRRELVKQATLEAPHVSTPLATGEADGVTWIFREWLEGVSLRVRLSRSGPLEQSEALTIAAQLASGLDDLHRAGLLHRDIKPSHVFMQVNSAQPPRALLIDAGVCTMHDLPGRGLVGGAPGYVAPEQLQGKLVSFRSDLYALGCVIYEMLTGRPAFPGGSTDAILAAQLTGELPKLPEDVPSAVSALLKSLLSRDPQERPFSAQKLRRTLDPFLPDGAHVNRQSPQTFGSLPEQRRSLTPGGNGSLRPPTPPTTPSRIPPPPPKTPSSAPAKSVAPPLGRVPSAPPPPRKPSSETTQQLDMEHIVELAPSPGKKQPSTAAPRPSERSKGRESTQALDLDQLLEIVPRRSTPPARPSVPPPARPSSVPPAKSADMTQPIRLEQILAVADTRKKDLELKPPTPSKGLMQTEERRSVVDPTPLPGREPLARQSLASESVAPPRPSLASESVAPPHPSLATHAPRPSATDALVEALTDEDDDPPSPAAPVPSSAPEFHADRAGTRRSLASLPPVAPLPEEPRSLKAAEPPAVEPVRQRESLRPAASQRVETPAPAPSPSLPVAAPSPSLPVAAPSPSLPVASAATAAVARASARPPAASPAVSEVPSSPRTPTSAAPAPAAQPAAMPPAASVAPAQSASQPVVATPSAPEANSPALSAPVPATAVASAAAPPSERDEAAVDGAPPTVPAGDTPTAVKLSAADESARVVAREPVAPVAPAPATHRLSYHSEHPRSRRESSPTLAYAIAAAAVLALGIVSVTAFFGNDDAPTAAAPARPEQREEAKGAVGRDEPGPAAAAPALAETPRGVTPGAAQAAPAPTAPAPAAAPAPTPVAAPAAPVAAPAPAVEPKAPVAAAAPVEQPRARKESEPKSAESPRSSRRAAREARSEERPRASSKESDALSTEAKMERWAKARDEARAHYAAKRYSQAANSYAEAAKYNTSHAGTFAGLGAARLLSGDTRGAIQAYQRAIQISPTTSAFHSALGKSYMTAGEKAKARTAYKRALALDPKNEGAKQALAELGD